MIRAYRLVYPESVHAPPQLWEWEQPHIGHVIRNARTFRRHVVQRYFPAWEALAQENQRLWEVHYLPRALYQPWETWHAWLAEYRTLVLDVQDIYEDHHAGVRISQLDCTEGHFYREALAHLRAVHLPGRRSKLEEKRLDDMERIVRTWNTILGAARRILRVHGWDDPFSPRLQILPSRQPP